MAVTGTDYFKKKKAKETGIDYFKKDDLEAPSQEAEDAFQEYLKGGDVNESVVTAKKFDSGTAPGDYSRSLAIGLNRFGQTIGRGIDVVGNIDPTRLLTDSGEGVVDRVGQWVEEFYKKKEQEDYEALSPAMKEAGQLKYTTDVEESWTEAPLKNFKSIFGGEAWKSIPKVGGSLLQSAPSTIVGMGTGIGITSGLIKKGVSSGLAGVIGGFIGEGATASVESGKEIYDMVVSAPYDVISTTPEYQKAWDALSDKQLNEDERDQQARELVADHAAMKSMAFVFAATGVLGSVSGAYMGHILDPKGKAAGGIARKALTAGAAETLQEAPQSGYEVLERNLQTKKYINPNQDIWEGVKEGSTEGGVQGFVMGAGMGGGAAISSRGADAQYKIHQEGVRRDASAIDTLRNNGILNSNESVAAVDILGGFGLVDQPIDQIVEILSTIHVDSWAEKFAGKDMSADHFQAIIAELEESGVDIQDEGVVKQAMFEKIIPSMTMSLQIGLGTSNLTNVQKRQLLSDLNNIEDPKARSKAIGQIEKGIENPISAKSWAETAMNKVDAGEEISLNQDFIDYASQDEESLQTLRELAITEDDEKYTADLERKLSNLKNFKIKSDIIKDNISNLEAEISQRLGERGLSERTESQKALEEEARGQELAHINKKLATLLDMKKPNINQKKNILKYLKQIKELESIAKKEAGWKADIKKQQDVKANKAFSEKLKTSPDQSDVSGIPFQEALSEEELQGKKDIEEQNRLKEEKLRTSPTQEEFNQQEIDGLDVDLQTHEQKMEALAEEALESQKAEQELIKKEYLSQQSQEDTDVKPQSKSKPKSKADWGLKPQDSKGEDSPLKKGQKVSWKTKAGKTLAGVLSSKPKGSNLWNIKNDKTGKNVVMHESKLTAIEDFAKKITKPPATAKPLQPEKLEKKEEEVAGVPLEDDKPIEAPKYKVGDNIENLGKIAEIFPDNKPTQYKIGTEYYAESVLADAIKTNMSTLEATANKNIDSDYVSTEIKKDWGRLVKAEKAGDTETIKKIALKYQQEAHVGRGGGGAGPKKTKQPRRSVSQIYEFSKHALKEKPIAKEEVTTERTHDRPEFKGKAFISMAEGQKAMFYGDQYFETIPKNEDLAKDETGTNPVLDVKGNPAGAVIAYPTGRILVYDVEKASVNKELIKAESKKITKPLKPIPVKSDKKVAEIGEKEESKKQDPQTLITEAKREIGIINRYPNLSDNPEQEIAEWENVIVENGKLLRKDAKFSVSEDLDKVKPTKDKNFKKWSKEYPVLEGHEIADANPEEGVVVKVSHGTTNEFDIFDPTQKGQKEGQFGQVNYFTSDKGDADINYAGTGPDLTNRIENRTERLEQELEEYDFEEIKRDFGLPEKFTEDTGVDEIARFISERELLGKDPKRLDLYVRLDNPVYIGGNTTTRVDNFDSEGIREDATEQILEENDASKKDVGKYEDEIQERVDEIEGDTESEVFNAIQKALYEVETNTDITAEKIYGDLELYDWGITATELEDRLRASETLMYAEDYEGDGGLLQSHIIGLVFKHLGYDGIILQNADKRFENMDMGYGTSHVHVFEDTPTQIKSRKDNVGYSPKEKSIYLATTEDKPPGKTLTPEEIKAQFPGQDSTIEKDGTITIRFKNGKFVKVISTKIGKEDIDLAVEQGRMSKTGKILGKTEKETITLNEEYADNATLLHEIKHVLDNLNIITPADNLSLQIELNKLIKQGKFKYNLSKTDNKKLNKEENLANVFAQVITDRANYRNTRIGVIIQKVMDFIDGLIYIGRQSTRKLAREVESGKIFERKVNGKTFKTRPMYEQAADPWYSQLTKSVEGLQESMPAQQWKAVLKSNKLKQQGVKEEEIGWSGVNDWLDSKKGRVTRQEVVEYLKSNEVVIEEVVKKKGEQSWRVGDNAEAEFFNSEEEANEAAEEWRENLIFDFDNNYDPEIRKGDPYGDPDGSGYYIDREEQPQITGLESKEEAQEWIDDYIETQHEEINNSVGVSFDEDSEGGIGTKFSQYQLPGASNYKEVLLRMPAIKSIKFPTYDEWVGNKKKSKREHDAFWAETAFPEKSLPEDTSREEYKRVKKSAQGQELSYKSPHYDEPNILVHVRMSEREVDGKRVLHVEEVQSDWMQEGRKKGFVERYKADDVVPITEKDNAAASQPELFWYFEVPGNILQIPKSKYTTEKEAKEYVLSEKLKKEGVPQAPFKTKWSLLAIKHLVRYAAENNFDALAWSGGDIQFQRWGSEMFSWKAKKDSQGNKFWRFHGKEQQGGEAFAGMEAELIKEAVDVGNRIDTKEDTKIVVGKVMSRQSGEWSVENWKKHIDKVTDNIWDRMQTEDQGSTLPRKEGMAGFYDKMLPSTVNKFFNKKAWGKAKVGEIVLDETPKPLRVRELVDNFFGRENLPAISLNKMDAVMISASNNDKVRGVIIHFIPRNVMNDFAKNGISAEEFISDPSMHFHRLPVDSRHRVSNGIVNALSKSGALIRTGLSSAREAGLDKKLFPTLKASDLSFDEAFRMTFPESFTGRGEGAPASGLPETTLGTKLSPALLSDELFPAKFANFIKWHNDIVPHSRRKATTILWNIPITPEMKSKSLREGMPLFSIKDKTSKQRLEQRLVHLQELYNKKENKEDATFPTYNHIKALKHAINAADDTRYQTSEDRKTPSGETSIKTMLSNLKKTATTKSDAVKASVSKEKKIIEAYRKLELLSKDPHASIASKQKMLAGFLKTLPEKVRAKVITPLSVISRYKQTETHKKRIDESLAVAEKELTTHIRRWLINDIIKGISPKKRAKNRIKKGTLGHDADRDIQFIREAYVKKDISSSMIKIDSLITAKEADLQEANEKKAPIIEEEIADLKSQQSIIETFGDMKSQNIDELLNAKEALSSIVDDGKAWWRALNDAHKAKVEPMIAKAQQDISGQEEPTLETAAGATQREAKMNTRWGKGKGVANAVENSVVSFEFLMNKLASKAKGKILKSFLVTDVSEVSNEATRNEEIFESTSSALIHRKAMEIYNAKNPKSLKKKFISQSVKQTDKIFSYDENGKKVEAFVLSQLDGAYWYAVRKNDDSIPTFEKMGMTDQTFKEIESFMGPELKAWVDWNVDEHLQDFHFSINGVYRQINGTNLTKTKGYFTWLREVTGDVNEKGIGSSSHETGVSGLSKSAFHERVKNTNRFRVANFNDVLTGHVSDMNNYRAWAVPTKIFNSIFNNRKTQKLIEQNHSKQMLGSIKKFQKDFTKSPREMRGELPWLDNLRGNITTAMVALNPTIYLKQLTSIPAMAESIPTKEWIRYSADFWKNPLQAWKTLKDSTGWEERKKMGMERDLRTASAVSGSQAIANVRNLKYKAMFLVRWGDSAAILVGGYPVYKYHFETNKATMGKAKAHQFALTQFENAMNRTQQSSKIKDQGNFMRSGSYAKLFSMFITAPKQYTSQITAAIRQISKDPTDSDAYKRLFIFGVMMPSLFQATASGLLGLIGGDEDDKDKFVSDQIKAILQSPLNGIPIIRDLQKGVWESAMGEWYGTDVEYSPVTQAGQSLLDAVFNGAKLVSGGEMSDDQRSKYWEKTLSNAFETAGYAYGLPAETVRKMFMENWADIVKGETDYPIRRGLGFSRYATGEQASRFNRNKTKIKDAVKRRKDKEIRPADRKFLRLVGSLKHTEKNIRKLKKQKNKVTNRLVKDNIQKRIDTFERTFNKQFARIKG